MILLSDQHREIVESEIRAHCEYRQWRLWIANPRTNHVHVVVTAPGYAGSNVRDQLKANCTRGLREHDKRELIEIAGKKQISMLVPVVALILPVAIMFAFYPGIVAIRTLAR